MGQLRIMTVMGLSAFWLTGIVVDTGFSAPSTAAELAQAISTPTLAQDSTSSTATQTTPFPTLTLGSTGDVVRQLQATLTLMGFYQGAIDGSYSESTQTAVTNFQAAAGIAADGITGPSTWQKLLPSPRDITTTVVARTAPVQTATSTPETPAPEATPSPASAGPPILRPGAEGGAVAQLQRELQALGYYDGAIDGGYGEQTQAAVVAFQTDKQLLVDAIVGPSTWDALSEALN